MHTPNDLTMNEFVFENPPDIKSYLYRFVKASGRKFLNSYFKSVRPNKYTEARKKEVMHLSEKIIIHTIGYLEEKNHDCISLVFQPDWSGVSSLGKDGWREHFLKQLFEKNRVKYIWSKSIIRRDMAESNRSFRKYFISDGHPSVLYNELLSTEIKNYVLGLQ